VEQNTTPRYESIQLCLPNFWQRLPNIHWR
jgi:hypothetical protein